METNSKTAPIFTVFWSWQSDSHKKENKYFIEDCIRRAAKQIGHENAIVIVVDRDTKGKGGTPNIAETILAKIYAADVFIWDATLVYSKPRPSPNANVLFELGYALAIMGEGRIIGVMNHKGNISNDDLPFDLRHKRWPIKYFLSKPHFLIRKIMKVIPAIMKSYYRHRETVRKGLVDALAGALRAALNEPKDGALYSDVDFYTAQKLWSIIASPWITYWQSWRLDHPQYEKKEDRDRILKYLDTVDLPENVFRNEPLKTHHEHFVSSLSSYAYTSAIEMAMDGPAAFVINAKANHEWRKSYDEEYERECKVLIEKIELVWAAWVAYVEELRSRYPEIIFTTEAK